MPTYTQYSLPSSDGDITYYSNLEGQKSGNYRAGSHCIFVNGMGNSPKNHRESSVELSLMMMMPVYGLFNQSPGFFSDIWQCAADKYKFDGPLARSANKGIIEYLKDKNLISTGTSRAAAMREILGSNKATVALFDMLREPKHKNVPIYAHSQGNLILANALTAVAAVDGQNAITGREVHSFGSPARNWPRGLNHQEYAFTGDPVALLADVDMSFKISKLGAHKGSGWDDHKYSGGLMLIDAFVSHGFLIYMKNDPAFVTNRFRWGGWGVTFSMDEDGLANALIDMGSNTQRVTKIFEHLAKHHNSDSDDIAMLYVKKMIDGAKRHPRSYSAFYRDAVLRKKLAKIIGTGWVTTEEKAYAKALAKVA